MSPLVVGERLIAQLLAGPPARDTETVAGRLLAVQAQDPRGARLAIRSRSTGLLSTDVDAALTSQRSVVIGWLNRGTLHLVRLEDYWWLHALTAPPLRAGIERRLAQEGVSTPEAERGVALIGRSLADAGPLTRREIRARLDEAGVRTAGQALVHLLALASLRGLCVRGPLVGAEQAFVLARDWIGPPPADFDRDRALAELARRYLAGHGPASERDLAKWAGLSLRDARRGLVAVAGSLADRDDGLAALARRMPDAAPAPPRLLGAFDPLLLGWTSRRPIVGDHTHELIAGGVFRPFALVGGLAAGTWRIEKHRVVLAPFGSLPPELNDALAADAEQVERFLGLRPGPA